MKTQLFTATLLALALSIHAQAEGIRANPMETPTSGSPSLGGYPPVNITSGQPGGLPAGPLPTLPPVLETSDFSGLNLLGFKNGRALISSGTNVAFYSNGDTLFIGTSAFNIDFVKDGVYLKSAMSNKRVWKVGETQAKPPVVTAPPPVVNTAPTYKITGNPIEISSTGETATTTSTSAQNGMVR